jgi:hypothetical protein
MTILISIQISPQSIRASLVTAGYEAMDNVQGDSQPSGETGLGEDRTGE